jgi:hypothetical protein
MRNAVILMAVGLGLVGAAYAQEHHEQMSTVKASPEFEQMKKLVGKWEGTPVMSGHPSTTEFRLTGDGSALMEIMGAGTPYEMVTMYHMDGGRFLATHYCAAHNQPRMEAQKSDGNTVEFKFLDGTNISAGDSHMDNVKVTLADADHHKELWTSEENGKADSMEFDFHRVK